MISAGVKMNNKLNFWASKKIAFTLAEVLLATAIVGIIAGLVLPSTISRAQDRGFGQAYERNINAISDAVNTLIVLENKDFFKTDMYKDAAQPDYEGSSGTFIKKYMKVSRYCGSGASNAQNCFASKYYQYNDNKKNIYSPAYDGACAILKNGASLCLLPQIGTTGVKGIIDLNGRKGPNIFGRDLRIFTLPAKTQNDIDATTNAVAVVTAPDLNMSVPACVEDPTSYECCSSKTKLGLADPCCQKYPELSACPTPIQENPCIDDPNSLACCLRSDRLIAGPFDACCGWEKVRERKVGCEELEDENFTLHYNCSCTTHSCSCFVAKQSTKHPGMLAEVADESKYSFRVKLCYGSSGCEQINNIRPGMIFGNVNMFNGPNDKFSLENCHIYYMGQQKGTGCESSKPGIIIDWE